jgi:hypothetical protein
MNTYHQDIIAWAAEQAHLLRTKSFSSLDIEHVADEIEDVGKSEQRELMSRMTVLLAHLLKWKYQPTRRSHSWEVTIRNQRKAIIRHLKQVPSLKVSLDDPEWWDGAWGDAVDRATKETRLKDFPESCPWSFFQIADNDFWPNEENQ